MSCSNEFPSYRGEMVYTCLGCDRAFGTDELLYICPACGEVLLLEDRFFERLKETPGHEWRNIFDARAATKRLALRGIFRFYELMAPVIEEEDILYLGEGNTPVIEASAALQKAVGARFAVKNDGQNPSASFKDRGMACAFSLLKSLLRKHDWKEVLTICASTGDTSAAAALYASYMDERVKSVVLLPHGRVTPQQLAQPLGSGAVVLEVPGVFDDCMKVVEFLAERYRVALLNSKNSWRILGQESFAFELAQWQNWETKDLCVFVPVGNAGNITAVMRGFLKLYHLGIIDTLPRLFGVQSRHADPVHRYYDAPEGEREFKAVTVSPSVAQAAMIGNPVSFPRVRVLAKEYQSIGGQAAFQVLQVEEQTIMDSMLEANRHGHIVCTQGGESLAGLKKAKALGLIAPEEYCVLDSTAHALKFMDFQNMYFNDTLPEEFGVVPDLTLVNRPELLMRAEERAGLSEWEFLLQVSDKVARRLELEAR